MKRQSRQASIKLLNQNMDPDGDISKKSCEAIRNDKLDSNKFAD